jgi:hypothetical protein
MTLIHWLMSILVMELIAVLMVQIMRSLHYFEFGAYPTDTLFPLWITKDIGASLIIFDLALLHFRKDR